MTTLREAAQQALEALEALDAPPSGVVDHYELDRRKQALRAALAQQEQEPVAFADRISFDQAMKSGKGHDVWSEAGDYEARTGRKLRVLYTHPPRREWQGLTEKEINDGRDQLPTEDLCNWSFRQGVYFAEKALKERNNG
jgi:hypothetical protein